MRALFTGAWALLAGSIAMADGDSPDAKALAKARLDAAKMAYQLNWAMVEQAVKGNDLEKVCFWSKRWLEAQKALLTNKSDHIAPLIDHLERMKKAEAIAKARAKIEISHRSLVAVTEYYRVEAELLLVQAKKK
ncbi:MAG TPA: hypothetical protein VKE98_23990 [Gemmataceae bacterium]|nr:hypothetical protein [Gemmataceae bacterium]